MALDPSACTAAISIAYQDAAGIDAAGGSAPAVPAGDFPADFAAAYNDYASAGIVLGAANTGGDASIIEAAMRSADNSAAAITALATGFANYWATIAIDPGIPSHGGTAVASVVNNAATLVSSLEAAITASMTSSESKPWFETFISNVQDMAVSSIVWTVVELMPPSGTPSPFPEVIS